MLVRADGMIPYHQAIIQRGGSNEGDAKIMGNATNPWKYGVYPFLISPMQHGASTVPLFTSAVSSLAINLPPLPSYRSILVFQTLQ
jgi:hypothetical protein